MIGLDKNHEVAFYRLHEGVSFRATTLQIILQRCLALTRSRRHIFKTLYSTKRENDGIEVAFHGDGLAANSIFKGKPQNDGRSSIRPLFSPVSYFPVVGSMALDQSFAPYECALIKREMSAEALSVSGTNYRCDDRVHEHRAAQRGS